MAVVTTTAPILDQGHRHALAIQDTRLAEMLRAAQQSTTVPQATVVVRKCVMRLALELRTALVILATLSTLTRKDALL